MAAGNSRTHWGPNTAIRFSLSEYTRRLGSLFGYEAEFGGPGPTGARGSSDSPTGDFAVRLLFSELYSKFDDETSSSSKEDACLRKFFKAEDLCRDTNWRFKERSFLYHGTTKPGYTASKALWLARRKIEWLLGEYSDSEVCDGAGFGKGATARLRRQVASLAAKMGGCPYATKSAALFVRDILPQFPVWEHYLSKGPFCQVVNGNKLTTVPKDYKSDRMIAIEPEWNLFLQKGFGHVIRNRLRKVGIDLNDQSNNAFCAGLGSLYGDLATIDLSMASDCLSIELVRFLLPPEWYDALEQCRSRVGVLPSRKLVIYEKFSSMGNGATFELETMIFWALASAVIDLMQLEDRRCLVYGDDIVVPTTAAQNVVDVLTLAGFVPNMDKTFISGPYRESCGSQYYLGTDVTPIYVRESVSRLDRLLLLHNNTCRLLIRYEKFCTVSGEDIQEFLSWIRSHAPEHWRKPRLPTLDAGDGAFYGSFEECTPQRLTRGYSGWRIKTLQSQTQYEDNRMDSYAQYLAGLWLIQTMPDDRFVRDARHLMQIVRFPGMFLPDRIEKAPLIRAKEIACGVKWVTADQTVDCLAPAPWWVYV
jgi:hypothetical protein